MTFAAIVSAELLRHKTRTLVQLYDTLHTNPDVSLDGSVLKHRIRSALYGLKQAKKVDLVSKGTYTITDSFK